MNKRLFRVAYAAAILASSVVADTVTLTDNRSLNGFLIRMDANELRIKGRFPKGEVQTLSLPVRLVRRIEFNGNGVNTGAPPEGLAARPPQAQSAHAGRTPSAPKQDTVGDQVFRRDGTEEKCAVALIDEENVHCGKNRINKNDVKAIRLAAR
jgi:hypothetical protein